MNISDLRSVDGIAFCLHFCLHLSALACTKTCNGLHEKCPCKKNAASITRHGIGRAKILSEQLERRSPYAVLHSWHNTTARVTIQPGQTLVQII